MTTDQTERRTSQRVPAGIVDDTEGQMAPHLAICRHSPGGESGKADPPEDSGVLELVQERLSYCTTRWGVAGLQLEQWQ